MFDAVSETAAEPPAPPPQTAARERMGMLRRFSEIGLRIAERLDRHSEAAAVLAESPFRGPEAQEQAAARLEASAKTFSLVCRASSLALALEDRIERGPKPETPPLGPGLVCAVPREAALTTRREEVESGVRRAINRSAEASPRRDIDDLFRNLDDLLAREMAGVDAFLGRPADEIIASLCRRLGIDPDWASVEEDPSPPSNPAPVGGGMGPVAEQREGGVIDAARRHAIRLDADPTPAPQSLTADRSATSSRRRPANTPSSQSPAATGAHPSPCRGKMGVSAPGSDSS